MPFFIILAGKSPARHRVVLTHCVVVCLSVQMNAIAVSIVRDEIRSSELPADDTLFHILFRKGKRKFAAYSLVCMQPALAVHMRVR